MIIITRDMTRYAAPGAGVTVRSRDSFVSEPDIFFIRAYTHMRILSCTNTITCMTFEPCAVVRQQKAWKIFIT